jgi:hypothetical protein
MIKIQFRRKPAPPIEPLRTGPMIPGACLFTLRSVPRHHDEIKAQIEQGSGARVYFSEPLAYLHGQGISLFRVEAANFDFLDGLYRWWAAKEHAEAFAFDINLFFDDIVWIASLRDYSPAAIKQLIEDGAPRTQPDQLVDGAGQPVAVRT